MDENKYENALYMEANMKYTSTATPKMTSKHARLNIVLTKE